MNAKQFLGRARWADKEIESLMRTRDETFDRLTHITQSYDGDGAQATKEPHKFDSYVALEQKRVMRHQAGDHQCFVAAERHAGADDPQVLLCRPQDLGADSGRLRSLMDAHDAIEKVCDKKCRSGIEWNNAYVIKCTMRKSGEKISALFALGGVE